MVCVFVAGRVWNQISDYWLVTGRLRAAEQQVPKLFSKYIIINYNYIMRVAVAVSKAWSEKYFWGIIVVDLPSFFGFLWNN